MNDQNRLIRTSKFLSYLLRHGAAESNLTMTNDGYVPVESILNLPKSAPYQMNLDLIKTVVNSNDKKRFEIKQLDHSGQWLIRACQGHSLKNLDETKMMKPLTDASQFEVIVHGTFRKFWHLIQIEGLKRMTRNHIHFATGYQNVISGMRKSCEVFIELDLAKCLSDDIKFFLSPNGVVLSAGIEGVIEPKYFKKVLVREGHSGVLSVLSEK